MTTIRQFHMDDLGKLSRCNFDALTETYDVRFYLEYHAKWPSLFQVCEDRHGNIVGYIIGKLESCPPHLENTRKTLPWHGHISALTVAPEARRMGIGRLLTQQLEAACNAADAWFVDLYVRSGNDIAINMYEKMGYSVYRVVKDYYHGQSQSSDKADEDAFDMRKPMTRDVARSHVREDGEKHVVMPHEVW